MSRVHHFCYEDAAAEVLDEIEALQIPLSDVIERLEEETIRLALQTTKGEKSSAARLLGMNRTTLQMRIRKYSSDWWKEGRRRG